jgi:DNA-binding response OmpR family regulator
MPASHHSASTAEPNAGPRRLLIVDDDKKFCRLLSEYLEPFGYQTAAVHTGPDGAERAVSEAWHAVILDMMLPGMNGLQVLQKIREVSEVPVLMLTARGEEVDGSSGSSSARTTICPRLFPRASYWRGCAR